MSDPWRKGWLASVDEPVLEPDRLIVDPHHHLWYELGDFPGPYLAADLIEDLGAGHRVAQTVYIEMQGTGYRSEGPPELRCVGETAFATEQAAAGAPIGGIVGHADLLRGAAIQPVLEAHIAAGGGRFRGIRQAAVFHAEPSVPRHGGASGCVYGDLGFRTGVALLGRLGLGFDAWNDHDQIPDLTALAQACPGTTIILNHYGGVRQAGPHAGEALDQWRRDLAQLAHCPNVVIKLGGIATPPSGLDWSGRDRPPGSAEVAARHLPLFEHALACFGPGRAMFESNFPVEKTALSYRVLWNAFKTLAAPLSETEKDALFRGTAMRVYGLA